MFRKIRRISDGSMMVSRNLHLPSHSETTETYPVAEIDPETTAKMFRFTPPADAKEVATLDFWRDDSIRASEGANARTSGAGRHLHGP